MENLKRVRFAQNDILILLREIVSCNPLENPARWKNVQQNLNSITLKNFSLRAIKSHANNLVLKWIKEERTNRAKYVCCARNFHKVHNYFLNYFIVDSCMFILDQVLKKSIRKRKICCKIYSIWCSNSAILIKKNAIRRILRWKGS